MTTSTISGIVGESPSSAPVTNSMAVERMVLSLPAGERDEILGLMRYVAEVFPQTKVLVAGSAGLDLAGIGEHVSVVDDEGARSASQWYLSAADYAVAGRLAKKYEAWVLLLGAASGVNAFVAQLAARNGSADLLVPRYATSPTEGLVNTAVLYPITRALFGVDIRLPLPGEVFLSQKGAERLFLAAQRPPESSMAERVLWPLAEASVTGLTMQEVDVIAPARVPTNEEDFNALFARVVGALFTDVELKASFWQRSRVSRRNPAIQTKATAEEPIDIRPMVENFRLAYANLQELWSLVLPPQSLLALKRLSMADAAQFTVAPDLWARVVYDFALAYRLRTINRGHLLGAMTPLYLAWVASHLRLAADAEVAPYLGEKIASAFEMEKPYFVSRWRWPDRFNP